MSSTSSWKVAKIGVFSKVYCFKNPTLDLVAGQFGQENPPDLGVTGLFWTNFWDMASDINVLSSSPNRRICWNLLRIIPAASLLLERVVETEVYDIDTWTNFTINMVFWCSSCHGFGWDEIHDGPKQRSWKVIKAILISDHPSTNISTRALAKDRQSAVPLSSYHLSTPRAGAAYWAARHSWEWEWCGETDCIRLVKPLGCLSQRTTTVSWHDAHGGKQVMQRQHSIITYE